MRLRPRGAEAQHLALARAGAVRVGGPQGQPDRHARATPTSSATSHAALRVADLAVFVVSAVEGVEVQTEVVWQHRRRARACRAWSSSTSSTASGPSFERTLDAAARPVRRRHRAARAADRRGGRVPRRRRPAHRHGVHLRRAARHTEGAIPDDIADVEHEVHDNLVEGIVVADDDLLERYLDGEIPSRRGARAHARPRRRRGHGVPGGVRLGRDRRRHRPAGRLHLRDRPVARRPPARRRSSPATPSSRDRARRRRASRWRSCSRRSPTRTSGRSRCSRCCRARSSPTTTSSTPAPAPTSGCTGCSRCGARSRSRSTSVPAGDIAAVAKLSATAHRRHARAEGHAGARSPAIEPPPPVLAVAIKARTQADEDKLGQRAAPPAGRGPGAASSSATTRPTRRCSAAWARRTSRSRSSGSHRKFGVDVDTEEVRVPYRETITGKAEAEGKYKKQTGGHGQFGVAWLRVEPLHRGEGFEFVDTIVGGAIPRQFIPAVEKGVEETMAHGRRVRLSRSSTCRSRASTASTTRSTRPRWLQDGGVARLQGGDGQGRRRSCSSRSRCSR